MADDFVSLADPQATPKKQSAAPPPKKNPGKAGGLFDELMTTLDNIDDPFTRSLVQGAMEARISDKIGQQFRFPDPGEQQLAAEKTERQMLEEHLKVKALRTQIVQAAMLDLSDTQRAALGIEPGEDVFQTDPAKAVEASQLLFEANLIPFKLQMSDVKAAGLPTNDLEAQSMDEQRQAEGTKRLEQSASGLRAGEALAKSFAEAGEGEGLIGEGAAKAMEAVTENDDVDEDRGSEAFYNTISNTVDDLAASTGQTPKFIASAMLSGPIGKRIKDELEGLDENNGLLVVGKGDAGVTDTATTYIAATAMDLFARAGVSDTEGMKMLGLDYDGFDFGSINTAVSDLAKKRGVKEEVQAAAFSRGFMETWARMAAKEQIGLAATKGK